MKNLQNFSRGAYTPQFTLLHFTLPRASRLSKGRSTAAADAVYVYVWSVKWGGKKWEYTALVNKRLWSIAAVFAADVSVYNYGSEVESGDLLGG